MSEHCAHPAWTRAFIEGLAAKGHDRLSIDDVVAYTTTANSRDSMQRISRNDFQTRFGRRPTINEYDGLYHRDLFVDRDAVISGMVEGSLYIRGGSQAVLTGYVQGSVHVGREAVLWVEGTIEGSVIVDGGAAFLNGTCSARGDRSAVVYDPSEPPDGETRGAS